MERIGVAPEGYRDGYQAGFLGLPFHPDRGIAYARGRAAASMPSLVVLIAKLTAKPAEVGRGVRMRVRVTNPHSDFCGEGGEVLRFFPPKGRSGSTYLVALDSGEAGYEGAMAFGDSEVVELDESEVAS